MPILAQGPDLGLNSLVQQNLLDLRAAAKGSQNLFYQRGLMQTPWGFAKFDLTTGLDSGKSVIAIFPYKENDGSDHIIAVTKTKIYDHDAVSEEWDNKTQSGLTMSSAVNNPISWATVGHDDTAIYLNDDSAQANTYYHIVVCNGLNNIQRWAGKYETDFADVVGGGGYHGGTTHRALQVAMSQHNRMLLLSPQDFNATSNLWTENNQQIRWPQIGKLESWTGTGSGFVNLLDTGGRNVWSASLGSQHIIYQTKGIWELNHVGGSTVFKPRPIIPDLGLLAAHLLISYGNVHYFVGTDLNVYAFGGSEAKPIGSSIHKYLQDDIDKQYKNRMWLVMGPKRERLWIFIVESGSTYITKAYYRNMQSGAWGIRDYSSKFSSSGTGITAVSLIGGQAVIQGDSYAEALGTLSTYSADVSKDTAGDVTQRYGDVIEDGTINRLDWSSLSVVADATDTDFTELDFSVGGLHFTFEYNNDPTRLVGDDTDYSNKILRIADGSDSTNMPYGTHYYTMTDVSSVNDGGGDYTVLVNLAYRDVTSAATIATGFAAADNSTNTPVLAADTTGVLFDPSGTTYRQAAEEVETESQMLLGDATGLVYQVDETYTKDDDNLIDARHYTPVFDLGRPDDYKRWPRINVTAEGTVDGAMQVSYRTNNFDTSDTGWADFTIDLTSQFKTNEIDINKTSKKIQFLFQDFTGNTFTVREYELKDAEADELLQADSSGLVFQFGSDTPNNNKRWQGLGVAADGSVGGAMIVSHRTGNFDTSDTGWTDATFDLTSDYQEKIFWHNKTSMQIQYQLAPYDSTTHFRLRGLNLLPPQIEDNR